MSFRKLILKLHLYLGLFCIPYLLIYGISSLNFNHHFLSEKSPRAARYWHKKIKIPVESDIQKLGESIGDSLEIYGWFIPWTVKNLQDTFQFEITNPGKNFKMTAARSTGIIDVEETPKPASSWLSALHALGSEIPRAPVWVNCWRYYQDLTVYSMVFWAITGVYQWITSKNISLFELTVLAGMFILSVMFILYLWLAG